MSTDSIERKIYFSPCMFNPKNHLWLPDYIDRLPDFHIASPSHMLKYNTEYMCASCFRAAARRPRLRGHCGFAGILWSLAARHLRPNLPGGRLWRLRHDASGVYGRYSQVALCGIQDGGRRQLQERLRLRRLHLEIL